MVFGIVAHRPNLLNAPEQLVSKQVVSKQVVKQVVKQVARAVLWCRNFVMWMRDLCAVAFALCAFAFVWCVRGVILRGVASELATICDSFDSPTLIA